MVTPLVAMMANDPLVIKNDFASIKTIICGAAPIGSALICRFLAKAEKTIAFQECYGMTEMTLCKNSKSLAAILGFALKASHMSYQ